MDYGRGTQILEMQGAPAARGGFMGAEPVVKGMQAGGYAPSQMDPSKVAFPADFEGFGKPLMLEELRRASADPLWRERAQWEAEEQRARAPVQEQAALIEAGYQRMRQEFLDELQRLREAGVDEEEAITRAQLKVRSMAGQGL